MNLVTAEFVAGVVTAIPDQWDVQISIERQITVIVRRAKSFSRCHQSSLPPQGLLGLEDPRREGQEWAKALIKEHEVIYANEA
jgi:hypothetical protein